MEQEMTCGWEVDCRDQRPVVCGRTAKAQTTEDLGPDKLVCGVHARSARAFGYEVADLPGPDVRVGQVWQDADSRGYGRRVRVIELVDEYGCRYAAVEQIVPGASKAGRRSRIRLDRFRPTSTGYRLVQDVEG